MIKKVYVRCSKCSYVFEEVAKSCSKCGTVYFINEDNNESEPTFNLCDGD